MGEDAPTTPEPTALPGPAPESGFESLPELLRTALVVDDNRVFRIFLRDLLLRFGFTVWEASGGEEGLRLALEERPWLILTDVAMPGMDGVEFCRRIRGHSLLSHTPLIFLSGWDEYKERYRGLEAGGDEFLSKDTSIRELLIRVQLVLKRYEAGLRGSSAGMEGRLELVGAPGILQMCHIGRLSGVLAAQSGARRIEVRFREGEIVGAAGADRQGEEAVFELLGWTRGRYVFTPSEPGSDVPLGVSFEQLLLEGCRRLDENRRASNG